MPTHPFERQQNVCWLCSICDSGACSFAVNYWIAFFFTHGTQNSKWNHCSGPVPNEQIYFFFFGLASPSFPFPYLSLLLMLQKEMICWGNRHLTLVKHTRTNRIFVRSWWWYVCAFAERNWRLLPMPKMRKRTQTQTYTMFLSFDCAQSFRNFLVVFFFLRFCCFSRWIRSYLRIRVCKRI